MYNDVWDNTANWFLFAGLNLAWINSYGLHGSFVSGRTNFLALSTSKIEILKSGTPPIINRYFPSLEKTISITFTVVSIGNLWIGALFFLSKGYL